MLEYNVTNDLDVFIQHCTS